MGVMNWRPVVGFDSVAHKHCYDLVRPPRVVVLVEDDYQQAPLLREGGRGEDWGYGRAQPRVAYGDRVRAIVHVADNVGSDPDVVGSGRHAGQVGGQLRVVDHVRTAGRGGADLVEVD